ncbi:LysE/ArgO family amino acid transporter [Ignatzschineria sp. RMDPL8A]|uniref:LysE/ArgO family amino acid transporter n=1 Tax=Ignatzschineria sp. RMDPL8A TaxID=2999236 RepID=UPI0024465FB4|nr:LysE/ArgO family amino acid transporter [Ignatzschineria sp. RMDPL8A]MDG9729047.1 LysE/ArgO family amino acid transporter [Ignatzschineria sp. RMDPL8A]
MDIIFRGMITSGALIIAIGAQNAFVLKQGLLKKNILIVSGICFVCDFLLMSIGVLGLGSFISQSKILSGILAILGAIFLFFYGYKSFLSAIKSSESMNIQSSTKDDLDNGKTSVIIATLAITLLNPHVYLDTVVIVGGIAGTLNISDKLYFLIGALFSSFIWFFGLGYGARLLIPLFKNPISWKVLETIIGIVMWWIAYGLIRFVLFS